MRNVKIIGYGKALASKKLKFGDQTRYRISEDENILSLQVKAIHNALECASLKISDIDLIVAAMATSLQGLPCNAAVMHEQVALGLDIPVMDINTSCTSFIAALDTISYLIDAGRYKNVLIFSGDEASCSLNPNQKESYELFSEAGVAFIVTKSEGESGIIFSRQNTWSEGLHDTEIRGGGSLLHPSKYIEETKEEYMFDMKGKQALGIALKTAPKFINKFMKDSNILMENIDLIIPHQASKALGLLMRKMNISTEKYIDYVAEYGNMVSAAIPYTLCRALEEGRIDRGDTIMLLGTAAGFSINALVMKY